MVKIFFIVISLVFITSCSEKTDPLENLAFIKAALVTCLNTQEYPNQCDSIKQQYLKAKLHAVSKGYNQDEITYVEKIVDEQVYLNQKNSPMAKLRLAFESTQIPTQPEDIFFKFFSSQFSCQDLIYKAELTDLYLWVARGYENGKLVFLFVPYNDLNIKPILSQNGLNSINSSPCLDNRITEQAFAIITGEQISKLRNTPLNENGTEILITVLPRINEASEYFEKNLARHCIHVSPSESGAEVKIFDGVSEIKNMTYVKTGNYSVNVYKPGFLPFVADYMIKKPTRIEASLKDATYIKSCEKSMVKIIDSPDVTLKSNCEWEFIPKSNKSGMYNFSVTLENNNSDFLYAVEYLEELYDSDGVKRRSESKFSTINSVNDPFANHVALKENARNLWGIMALKVNGEIIKYNNLGRLDQSVLSFYNGSRFGSNRVTTKIKNFYFVKDGAVLPTKTGQFGASDFRFISSSSECTVD